MPYIGGDLLVAADGLGGSGSAIHQIDRVRHTDMHSEIMSGIFGDISHASPELMQYIEELIAPMLDEKDDTSALWASRIVIARCVYALTEGEFKGAKLDDKKVRDDLSEFISEGLSGAVKTFDLKNGKYDNQRLLPTTLAFIRYTEGEDSVIAETVWAGDSRCYALLPSGLKLLSVDDEDDSGSITNLFYADNQKIRLNYLRHEIRKPCILMAVSDGIFDPFDPYDHLGVEHTLLSVMADSNSEQEFAEKLRSCFDDIHGDDATMAFVAFGYADFADLKNTLQERTNKILSIRQRQAELYSALEVMNLSEEEATHYVATRTADRYDHIVSALADALERGADDIAVTAQIRSIAEAARRSREFATEEERRKCRMRATSELSKYVLSHPECAIPEKQTGDGFLFNGSTPALMEFKKAAETLIARRDEYTQTLLRKEQFESGKQELHQTIQKKIDAHRKVFDDLWYDESQKAFIRRKEELRILFGWENIDNVLKGEGRLQEQDISDLLPLAEREWAFAVKEYLDELHEWRKGRDCNKKARNIAESRYKNAWNKLCAQLRRDDSFACKLLNHNAIVKFGFVESGAASPSGTGKSVGDGLVQAFKEKKTSVISEIVQALANGCDRTSVIDSQYNATKLEQFRAYYRLQNDPDHGIREFEQELLALEAQYTSFVDHAEL